MYGERIARVKTNLKKTLSERNHEGNPNNNNNLMYRSVSTQVQSTRNLTFLNLSELFHYGQCTHFKDSSTRCRRGNLRSF